MRKGIDRRIEASTDDLWRSGTNSSGQTFYSEKGASESKIWRKLQKRKLRLLGCNARKAREYLCMTENSVRNCPFFLNFTPIKKYQNFEIFVGTLSYAPGTINFSRNDNSRMSTKAWRFSVHQGLRAFFSFAMQFYFLHSNQAWSFISFRALIAPNLHSFSTLSPFLSIKITSYALNFVRKAP